MGSSFPFVRRKVRLGIVTLVLLLLAGAGWYWWTSNENTLPPAVDQASADPEVAAAIEAASKKVRESPQSAVAWGTLGQVFAANTYYEEAAICFGRAEELDPDNPRWPYYHGLSLQFTDYDSAIDYFKRAVSLKGNAPAMRLKLGEALLAQARSEEAEQQLLHLLSLDPENPRGHLAMARVAYLSGDLAKSRQHIHQAIGSPLTQKASHTLLAEIEQRSNNLIAAAQEHRLASELPDDQDWFDPLVSEVEQMRGGKQARLDNAVKLMKSSPAEGMRLLQKIIAEDPNWSPAWLSQGRALLEFGEYAEAEASLRQAVKLSPDSVDVNFYLGLALFQQGKIEAAGASFKEATRLKPDYALAYFNLGHCWKKQGKPKEALDAFQQAIRCKPGYAAAYANVGQILAEQGDKVAAQKYLQLAVELNPNDKMAEKLLERIKSD
jgi:tetratricopeptide (TPR) repeat protein